MSLYYYIYYALSHILQRRWRITPNILLLFCCYFFVTDVPQTLTSYCGCRFCGYFVFLFIAHKGVWLCVRVCFFVCTVGCVCSCICMRVQCYVISVAVLFFFPTRLFPRRARKLELWFLSLYGNRNFSKSTKLLLRWENAFEGINYK